MKKELNLAVIGSGHWGPNLIRNFHFHERAHVSWVCDLDAARLEVIKSNYQGIDVTTDWQKVVRDPAVDAVIIATPTASHYSIAYEALNAGKHLFIEKPLTSNSVDALKLVNLANHLNRHLMVGHVFLFNPGIQYIKKSLDDSLLGDLYYCHCTRTNLGPIRGDVNALWDLASHDVAVLLYLLGDLPYSVNGQGSAFINPPIEDVVFAQLSFSSKVVGNLHASWLDPKKVRQMVLVGSHKMLVFDDMNPDASVTVYDKNVDLKLSKTHINDTIHLFRKSILQGNISVPHIPFAEPLKNECSAFIQLVLDGTPNPCTARFGFEVVRVVEKIQESITVQGKRVSV